MKIKFLFLIIIFFNTLNAFAEVRVSNFIQPVYYFTGRNEQYHKINQDFAKGKKDIAITGISGIGKTQLARTYVEKEKEKYEIIWFFDCNEDVDEQFVKLAKVINTDLSKENNLLISEEVKDARKEVIKYLTPKNKWLLVFDNLKINKNDKINDILNWEHNGNIIYCTQDSKGFPPSVKMTELTKKETKELLFKLIGDVKDTIIDELIYMFKGNPILTVQAALFLRENKYMSVEEYKDILDKSGNKVEAHMELVIKQLTGTAKNLLNKMALLNNHKISRNIINNISNDKDKVSEDLYNLSRFGVILGVNEEQEQFEIHDTIKDAVLKIAGFAINQKNVNELLNRFNRITPPKEGSLNRYSAMVKDETMISNHETLLKNAEKYHADLYEVMELHKNLMDYYGINKDYSNCKRITDWLKKQENENRFNITLMDNDQKAAYCWYLALMGMYEDKTYFTKAIEVLNKVKDYPRTKTGIYDIIALTEINLGNLTEAARIVPIIEKINNENLGKVNANRLFYVKAKLFLAQGNYKKALKYINEFINAEEALVRHNAGNNYYLIKAEILNNMQNFGEAYNILDKLCQRENIAEVSDVILISILTQMCRAEIGMNKIPEATEHIKQAKIIYIKALQKQNNEFHKHEDIAAAMFITEGDLALLNKHYDNALSLYQTGEQKYILHFGNNLKSDIISNLYFKITRTALLYKNNFLYNRYLNKHENIFGVEHLKTKEIYKMEFVN